MVIGGPAGALGKGWRSKIDGYDNYDDHVAAVTDEPKLDCWVNNGKKLRLMGQQLVHAR